MVIGVITIVFGALAAMQGCISATSIPFVGWFSSRLPSEQSSMFEGLAGYTPWLIASATLTSAFGGVLLAAGIGLVKRRGWGRTACMVWAVPKMLFVIINSVLTHLVQQTQFEAMQDMLAQDPNIPAAMPGIMSGVMQAFGVVAVLLGILWGWALPVFVLIWFSRGKIKDEVSGWSGTQTDSI